ncbi:MAG: tRNA adenosine(34) deaminase TadA [Gammaproteobacteria bacterium]
MSEKGESDEVFMREALTQARWAGALGEIPVGAVVVRDGEVIAKAHNAPISSCDPTGHAEIRVLRAAAQHLKNYRLVACDVYVTLEPCMMCFGALVHARIRRLVYGAREPRAGVIESQLCAANLLFFNHNLDVQGGVLETDCSALLSDFFRERRRGG